MHLLLLWVTWFAEHHVTAFALPTQQRHRHHHHHHYRHNATARSRHGADTPPPVRFDTEVPPSLASSSSSSSERVVFAARRPTSPPWFVDRAVAAQLLARAADDRGQ